MTASYIITRPPSGNNLFANVPGKGRVKTPEYVTWIHTAGWELKLLPKAAFEDPVRVVIEAQRALTKKGEWSLGDGDSDNVVKAVLDLLVEHRIIIDDKAAHVYGHSMDWVDDLELGARQVRVTVEPVESVA